MSTKTQVGSIDLAPIKSAHDAAAQVATSYVTETGNGIKVHPEGDTHNYVEITDDIDIWRQNAHGDDVVVASFGEEVVVGAVNGNNVLISSDGVAVRDGSTDLAYFGVDGIRVGSNTDANVIISPSETLFNGINNVLVANIGYGNTGQEPVFYSLDINRIVAASSITETPFLFDTISLPNIDFSLGPLHFVLYVVRNSQTTAINFVITSNGQHDYGDYSLVYTDGLVQLFYNSTTAFYYRYQYTYSVVMAAPHFLFGTTNASVNDFAMSTGRNTQAGGVASFACGQDTTATGNYSHAEGHSTTASHSSAHAEGANTTASEHEAHAEGNGTTARGVYSHAEGYMTLAYAAGSHAGGYHTAAYSQYQTAIGKYNELDSSNQYAVIIGNGDSSTRSDAARVAWDGNVELAIDTTAATGTTDGDLYAAIAALNWEGDVIS